MGNPKSLKCPDWGYQPMNRDTYLIRSLLLRLLQDPSPTASSPSGDHVEGGSSLKSSHQAGPDTLSFETRDPLDSEEVSSPLPEVSQSQNLSESFSLFELGDIPAVQDRFQALLKRRLQTEIASRPPLFPWETEIQEYPIDYPTLAAAESTALPIWMAQLRSLSLPITLPDSVLASLLEQCQTIVQTSLKQGVKLVKVTEELFPDQPQALGEIARIITTSGYTSDKYAYRSAPELVKLPEGYETANPVQKIALSMLAAQEIMSSLTLNVSPQQPRLEREWLTANGLLKLEVIYQTESITVQAQLPCGGHLKLQAAGVQTLTERSQPGWLNVNLMQPELNQIYPLEVGLEGAEQQHPLQFVICPMEQTETLG